MEFNKEKRLISYRYLWTTHKDEYVLVSNSPSTPNRLISLLFNKNDKTVLKIDNREIIPEIINKTIETGVEIISEEDLRIKFL